MERPKVGVGVIIMRGGKVLMHKRKAANGRGTWSFPGGHLEFSESFEECAARETMEEASIAIRNAKFATATNDIFDGKHYITIYMLADAEGEPRVMEPEKCERWEWFSWDELPKPLFTPVENLLKQGWRPE